MLNVITGFHPAGYEEYGRAMLIGFNEFWPKAIPLSVYTWEQFDFPTAYLWTSRIFQQIPRAKVSELETFLSEHDNPAAHGKEPRPSWRAKEVENGYSFRTDAWKFSQMCLYTWHAAHANPTGLLCWLDGDVMTHKNIPPGFIEGLLPDSAVVAYPGRDNAWSEIGFQLYRLPEALPLIDEYARPYLDGSFYDLTQWHSAFLFDLAREKTGLPCHNLTPGGRGHVWHQSELAEYTDHLKGFGRKAKGRSPERK